MNHDQTTTIAASGFALFPSKQVEHDYTNRYWGHDYTFDPLDNGIKGRMMGWGCGIKSGDFLIIQNGEGSTRYKVDSIQYFLDPHDMWSAVVSFAPRTHETR